jgi:hypothetical protein
MAQTKAIPVEGKAEVMDPVYYTTPSGERVDFLVDDVLYPNTPEKRTYMLVNVKNGKYLRQPLTAPGWNFA